MSDNTYKPGDKFLLPVTFDEMDKTHMGFAYVISDSRYDLFLSPTDVASLIPITRLSDLEAENARLREGMGWQPIETAPRDGTLVLLLINGEPQTGKYEGPSDGAIYSGTPSQYEWFIPSEWGRVHSSIVTHWVPLPEPPVS